jgi:hypothetical protein
MLKDWRIETVIGMAGSPRGSAILREWYRTITATVGFGQDLAEFGVSFRSNDPLVSYNRTVPLSRKGKTTAMYGNDRKRIQNLKIRTLSNVIVDCRSSFRTFES